MSSVVALVAAFAAAPFVVPEAKEALHSLRQNR